MYEVLTICSIDPLLQEEQLCLMLGVEQNLPSPNNVVTEEQLSAFEEHITLLSQKEVNMEDCASKIDNY